MTTPNTDAELLPCPKCRKGKPVEKWNMWERRWRAAQQIYERDKRFVDRNGTWGLRDLLDYVGQACGFTALQDTEHG